MRESWSFCLAVLFAAGLAPGCGEQTCRCQGDIEGVGTIDIACGQTACVGGVGLRCVDTSSVVPDPSACESCGDGTCGSTEDAATCPADCGIPPDDAGTAVSLFGLCTSDTDCMAGLRCATTFPTAFCTRDCTADAACAPGVCLNAICVPPCLPGARQCDRIGGACASEGSGSFCLPACEAPGITTTTCGAGLVCDRWWGECAAVPQSSGAAIGAPCTRARQCRTGLCYQEVTGAGPSGYVGGMCVGATRSRGPGAASEQGGCPPGSVTEIGQPEGDAAYCYPACTTNADCRPGYFCGPTPSMPRYCTPIDCDLAGTPACPAGTSCQTAFGVRRCVACAPACTGRACGPDGCGGSCGTCSGPFLCNDTTGACECTGELDAELCSAAGAACGSLTVTDRCGVARTVSCGGCVAPQVCGAIMPNRCDCVGETDAALCSAVGANCDSISAVDRCGAARMPFCGTCVSPATCGALAPNQCGCVGETPAELCAARGAECGTLSVTDRCGVGRSVSCGSCTLPQTCAGAGVPNTCGVCVPSCGTRVCGGDGCGGSCGSCPTGQRCNASGACEPIPCDPVANTLCAAPDKCDWTGSATACRPAGPGLAEVPCLGSYDCAAEYTCSADGMCREYCTTRFDCRDTGALCAFDLTGSPYGLCSVPCDPTYDAARAGATGCAFHGCRLLNTSRATEVTDCGATGSRPTGGSCTSTPQCFGGDVCHMGACRHVCTLGFACTGGTCRTVSGWTTYGVCM